MDVGNSGLNLYWASTPSVCQDDASLYGANARSLAVSDVSALTTCAFMSALIDP